MPITDPEYWEGLPPDEASDALAAAGVLAAAGTSDPGSLVELIGRREDSAGIPGSTLIEWTRPGSALLDASSAPALAAVWRIAVDHAVRMEGRPATVRLWLHDDRPAAAERLLRQATAPDDGVLVLSTAKLLSRSRPVPRWTWPLVLGVDLTAPRTAELLVDQPRWLPDLVRIVDLDDPHARCSLAVLPPGWDGSLLDPFGRPRAAAAVVLGQGPESPGADEMLDDAGLGSVAAVLVAADDDPRLLVEIVRHLSHDLSLDEAFAIAALNRGLTGHRLYAERAFLDRTRLRRAASDRFTERAPRRSGWVDNGYARSLLDFRAWYVNENFLRESGQATSAAYTIDESESATRRLEQRFLHAEAEVQAPARAVRRSGSAGSSGIRRLELKVWIAPSRRPGKDDVVPIDESSIDWDGDDVDLTVVLIPLSGRARPGRETLVLPRTGTSSTVRFPVRASEATPFRGRLVVLREHRFIQTATVTVAVDGTTELALETVVRPLSTDLFDVVPARVAIVHNHDASGRPLVSTITGDEIWSVVPGDYRETMAWLREGLEAAANDPDAFTGPDSQAFADVVLDLAQQGAELNRVLFGGSQTAVVSPEDTKRLVEAEQVSVLSVVPGDVLPIEFVYDRELAIDEDKPGRLCPNRVAAAQAGRCCAAEDASLTDDQTVCPFGFWGMRMVIERHVNRERAAWTRRQGGTQALAPSPSIDNQVATLRAVLGGASSKADLNPGEAWSAAKDQLSKRLGGNVRFVDGWKGWRASLDSESADILLLLPHVGRQGARPFLELGKDERLPLVRSLKAYVQGPHAPASGRAPIVLLLGCATAGDAPLNEFPGKFLDNGARLVIATLAVVRGRFVARLGAKLTLDLLDQSGRDGVQVGELLRRMRLGAFVDGDPTAMTLVAFGDSSWRLRRR